MCESYEAGCVGVVVPGAAVLQVQMEWQEYLYLISARRSSGPACQFLQSNGQQLRLLADILLYNF